MRDLNDLFYFTQVVEHGGFSAAGRALGVPKSKLSRRIAQLEDGLGTRLIQRTSRHFALTELGHAYYRHCRAMVIEAEAAEEVVEYSQAEPQGTIRLSCPVPLAQDRVGRIISRFLAEHPRVRIQMEATGRRVDVIEEGFDVAIRVRNPPLEDSGLIVKVLERHHSFLVGAPGLLNRLGRPRHPEDLKIFPSLGMTRAGDRHSWSLSHENGEVLDIPHTPRLVTDDMAALRQSARAGIGIVLLPQMQLADDLERGSLEKILPTWSLPGGLAHMVYPSRRGLVPAIRLFIDAVAREWSSA